MKRFLFHFLLALRPAFVADWLKQLIGIKREVVQTKQGSFFVDPVTYFGNALLTDGIYEPSMVKTLEAFLPPGGVFIDVGANEGYFSVIAANLVGHFGRVIAVEPQSRLFSVIKRNAALNDSNIEVCSTAISNKVGDAQLLLTASINNGASGFTRLTKYPLASERVGLTTLSALLRTTDITDVDLMKMDIEGHEYAAIVGSVDVFKKGVIKAIAVEFHPEALAKLGHSAEDITNFLIANGYELTDQFENTVFVHRRQGQLLGDDSVT